jgi:SAM-dependent methyltransferase
MNTIDKPKVALYEYGREYQLKQAEKYRNRKNNHWKIRIELAQNLITQYALPGIRGKPKKDIVVVDVGCSIGTFAIEYAKLGYQSYGIDFDPIALEIARQLSEEENVSPQFVCDDISWWNNNFPAIDIAICFDIFEHLHDDELGSFLTSIRKQFSKEGVLVFHTFPTQYEYIFFNKPYRRYPMIPFRHLSPSKFMKSVKIYSYMLDILSLLINGKIHNDIIKYYSHCNPTTEERLRDILMRAGFEIIFLELSNLNFYQSDKSIEEKFSNQPITYRNLYGVAAPKR